MAVVQPCLALIFVFAFSLHVSTLRKANGADAEVTSVRVAADGLFLAIQNAPSRHRHWHTSSP
eukprot:562563-Rhodomonas_salina.1